MPCFHPLHPESTRNYPDIAQYDPKKFAQGVRASVFPVDHRMFCVTHNGGNAEWIASSNSGKEHSMWISVGGGSPRAVEILRTVICWRRGESQGSGNSPNGYLCVWHVVQRCGSSAVDGSKGRRGRKEASGPLNIDNTIALDVFFSLAKVAAKLRFPFASYSAKLVSNWISTVMANQT
ncbi:hypothetical protein EJ02DRAFT_464137 [Clathrospora elynae]|uniref:Uncharacterized protein n=1 Tax=Clathrospora elynae TaxID=706981 RepID=A0A6A5T1J7_9PLEO|nr:hypothetical protein EJ02DRAFT_464137 [Clathrospora elynae]